MTLWIGMYPNLKARAEDELGEAIVSVLERELGAERAEEVLLALDREISPATAALKAELAAGVAKIQAAQKRTAAKLASTTGIQMATWGSGHYLVTYNGEPIGSIHPHTTQRRNGRSTYRDWIPSPHPWSTNYDYQGKPLATRELALADIWHWYSERQKQKGHATP